MKHPDRGRAPRRLPRRLSAVYDAIFQWRGGQYAAAHMNRQWMAQLPPRGKASPVAGGCRRNDITGDPVSGARELLPRPASTPNPAKWLQACAILSLVGRLALSPRTA